MNDSRELKALSLLSGLDESYIDEAQRADRISLVRRVRRLPMVLAAVISAVVISAVGVTAAVQGYISHRKNVEHEYTDSAFVDDLEKRQGQPIVAQNKHLRLTVDSIISDKMYIHATATLEGLDDRGKEYISKYLYLTDEDRERLMDEWRSYLPHMVADIGGSDKTVRFNQGADLQYGQRGKHTEGSFTFGVDKQELMGAETVHIRCLDWESISDNQGLNDLKTGIYEGIDFDLPLQTNFATLTLCAKTSVMTHYLYISEVGMYTDSRNWRGHDKAIIHYSDGRDEVVDTENIPAYGEKLYDLEKIERVEYDGYEFRPEVLEKPEGQG